MRLWGVEASLRSFLATTSSFGWFETTACQSSPSSASFSQGQKFSGSRAGVSNGRMNAVQIGFQNNTTQSSDVTFLGIEVDYDDTVGAVSSPSRLVVEGFECGDTREATTAGSPSVQTTTVYSGTYALRLNHTNNSARYVKYSTLLRNDYYLRCHLYVAAYAASGGVCLVQFVGAAGNGFYVKMDTAGKLRLFDSTGAIGSLSSSAVSTGVWHTMDIGLRGSSTGSSSDGVFEVKIDGVSFCSSSSAKGGAFSAPTISDVYIGDQITGTNSGADIYYDDIVVDQVDWIADTDNVVTDLTPNGAGTYAGTSGFVTGPSAGGTHYAQLNETVADDDTSYMVIPANTGADASGVESYAFTDLAGTADVVRGVNIMARCKAVSGSPTPNYGLTSDRYLTQKSAVNPIPGTSAYGWQNRFSPRASASDGVWTTTTVARSEVAVSNGSTSAAYRLTKLCCVVEYVPTTATTSAGRIQAPLVG
jgi:hypothetical protein